MLPEQFTDFGLSQTFANFLEKFQQNYHATESDIKVYRSHIEDLIDMLPDTPEAMKTFALGFLSMAHYIEKYCEFYLFLGSLCFLAIKDRGHDILPKELPDFMIELDMPNPKQIAELYPPPSFFNFSATRSLIQTAQTQGKTIGLVHGHFRILTPNHLVYLILAAHHCDILAAGFESENRTHTYKHKPILFPDSIRSRFISLACKDLNIIPFLIDNTFPYSDQGYSEMIDYLHPNIYFGQAQNPPNVKAEMKRRAKISSSTYHELPLIKSISTTQLEYIFGE